MKSTCLHCRENPQERKGLCSICTKLKKCECCGVIFGFGFSRPSKTNASRCVSCLYSEEMARLDCAGCGKRIPVYYRPSSTELHFVVRGNFCAGCTRVATARTHIAREKEQQPEYIGYLGIIYQDLMAGKIDEGTFQLAKEMNPHDVTREAAVQ